MNKFLIILSIFAFSLIGNNVEAYTFTKDLMVGSTGTEVAELQTFLEEKGFLVMDVDVAKGYFGDSTKTALAKFQQSVGLAVSGYFGPVTRAYLNGLSINTASSTPKIKVDFISSSSYIEDQGGVENNNVGNYTINFTIEAVDGDVYISRYSSTTVVNANGSEHTGARVVALELKGLASNLVGDAYLVKEGEIAKFRSTTRVVNNGAGSFYAVQMKFIKVATENILSKYHIYNNFNEDFRTQLIRLEGPVFPKINITNPVDEVVAKSRGERFYWTWKSGSKYDKVDIYLVDNNNGTKYIFQKGYLGDAYTWYVGSVKSEWGIKKLADNNSYTIMVCPIGADTIVNKDKCDSFKLLMTGSDPLIKIVTPITTTKAVSNIDIPVRAVFNKNIPADTSVEVALIPANSAAVIIDKNVLSTVKVSDLKTGIKVRIPAEAKGYYNIKLSVVGYGQATSQAFVVGNNSATIPDVSNKTLKIKDDNMDTSNPCAASTRSDCRYVNNVHITENSNNLDIVTVSWNTNINQSGPVSIQLAKGGVYTNLISRKVFSSTTQGYKSEILSGNVVSGVADRRVSVEFSKKDLLKNSNGEYSILVSQHRTGASSNVNGLTKSPKIIISSTTAN